MRGSTKISTHWYSEDDSVEFDTERISGKYSVKAFIRIAKTNDQHLTHTIKSDIITITGLPYDLRCQNNLPIYQKKLSDDWGEISDGIYNFKSGAQHIDILATGFANFNPSKGCLVCFTAARSSRTGTSAPYFSGSGISQRMGVPCLSVADSTLAISHSLHLGWYLGHKDFQDLPERIARILESFTIQYKTNLVLFGGSGGGFASLRQLTLLSPSRVSALVWGAQTSVANWLQPAVKTYLTCAFPEIDCSVDLRTALQSTRTVFDLTEASQVEKIKEHSVLFLQNRSDRSSKSQSEMLLAKMALRDELENTAFLYESNFSYWVGDWGSGHVAPPETIIISCLEQMLTGTPTMKIATQLTQNHPRIKNTAG
jgi:hypothetical protein